MASAARLPLKRIATVGIVGLAIGAWKSEPLIVKFLTGPGSYSRILALLVVLANYKNFPGVWHVCIPSPSFPSLRASRPALTGDQSANGQNHRSASGRPSCSTCS